MFFFDSDTCINLMRNKLPSAAELIKNSDPELFGIPAIVEGELRLGAQKSSTPAKNVTTLERFLAPFASIPFDQHCASIYGLLRAELEKRGCRIGFNDMLIAATTIANGATLITGNTREFSRIGGLSVENWEEINF